MTLKEKIAELNPNLISDDFVAGVAGCPDDYFDIPLFEKCCASPYNEELCRECWNREYIENIKYRRFK